MGQESDSGAVQRFTMGPNSELSVSNVSGSIIVRAGEGTEIVVNASKRGSKRGGDNTEIDVRREGNKVSVQTRTMTVGLINFGRSSAVDYGITVPRDCSVRLNAVSANVEVSGVRADVGVQTVSGDASIRDIAGDITLTTVSGDVTAHGLSGTLVARTTSGDATVMQSRIRRFNLTTVSGDFRVDTPLSPEEHSQAKTVSGDLELFVPNETRATVQLKSISGSVSCELPAEIIKSGRRHWQGRINGGGSHVEMNSVSGDLRIRRTSEAKFDDIEKEGRRDMRTDWKPDRPDAVFPAMPVIDPAPIIDAVTSAMGGLHRHSKPETPTAPAEPEDETAAAGILQALERGELSVDEAMKRLEEVGA